MNIFDVMSAKRPLREDHISYLLGWFLDPSGSHGLGGGLLQSFIGILSKQDSTLKPLKDAVRTVQPLAIGKEQKVSVTVINERQIQAIPDSDTVGLDEDEAHELQNSFALDVVIKVSIQHAEPKPPEEWIIAIENKTKVASQSLDQLLGQLRSLPQAFGDSRIRYVYLAPEVSRMYNRCREPKVQDKVLWMTWDDESTDGICAIASFVALVDEYFGDEAVGRTPPIPTETRYLLKCLTSFCMNGFGRSERVRRSGSRSPQSGTDQWGRGLETSAHRINREIVMAGGNGLTANEIQERINQDLSGDEEVGIPRIRSHVWSLGEEGKVVSVPVVIDGRKRVRYTVTEEGLDLWNSDNGT